jgi:hypothetical protein
VRPKKILKRKRRRNFKDLKRKLGNPRCRKRVKRVSERIQQSLSAEIHQLFSSFQ